MIAIGIRTGSNGPFIAINPTKHRQKREMSKFNPRRRTGHVCEPRFTIRQTPVYSARVNQGTVRPAKKRTEEEAESLNSGKSGCPIGRQSSRRPGHEGRHIPVTDPALATSVEEKERHAVPWWKEHSVPSRAKCWPSQGEPNQTSQQASRFRQRCIG